MLDCGKNPLLKKLEAAENALQDKLDNLKDLGAGALQDIKDAAEQLEKDLKKAIPEIPEIPDFQQEIKDLIDGAKIPGSEAAKNLLNDLDAIKAKWEGLVPDIQKTLDLIKDPVKLLEGISICDDVPKVEAKKNDDGTLAPTPTTVNQVENINPAPEQPDLTEVADQQIAPDELPKTDDDITSESEFTKVQAVKAMNEMIKAEKLYMKQLERAYADAVGNQTKSSSRNSNRYALSNQARQVFGRVPKDWKRRYPDGTVFDYYLTNPNASVPSVIDRLALLICKQEAYADMLSAISRFNSRIMNTLRKRPDVNGNERWVNGDFNPQYKEELSSVLYYDMGFGIRESNPEYGFGFRKRLGLQEACEIVPSAFKFKTKDYTANFVPSAYTISQMRSGAEPTFTDNTYSEMIKDYVEALFDAEVEIDKVTYKCYLVMISWTQNVSIDEIKESPQSKNFIPISLGGALPIYEDILLGTLTDEEFVEQQFYSSESFTPHFMYKVSMDGTGYVTQYTNTYEEHLELANLGYTHQLPK